MKSYKINPGDEFVNKNDPARWKIITPASAHCIVGGLGWGAGETFEEPGVFYEQPEEWLLVKSVHFKSLYKKLSQD